MYCLLCIAYFICFVVVYLFLTKVNPDSPNHANMFQTEHSEETQVASIQLQREVCVSDAILCVMSLHLFSFSRTWRFTAVH